jgi:hypothetical protein
MRKRSHAQSSAGHRHQRRRSEQARGAGPVPAQRDRTTKKNLRKRRQ